MRFLLVVFAIAACHRAPTATTPPENKAAAPDYRATADDELGFLPVGVDIVMGMNFGVLRSSAMWHSLSPQVDELRRELEKLAGECARPNPIDTLERGALAINVLPNGDPQGVIVVRGIDTSRVLDCMVKQTKQRSGTATLDRGVAIMSADGSRTQMAAAVVGPSTLVMQLDATVSYDSMAKVLASGAPLRSSAVFMGLYKRREPGAALWGMANGNASFFEELAQMGMRPKSIDGTLTVTDRLSFAVRMTMPSAADAAKVGGELDKIKGPAGNFVDRFETRIDDATVHIHVVVTEAQARSMLGMMGGGFGP